MTMSYNSRSGGTAGVTIASDDHGKSDNNHPNNDDCGMHALKATLLAQEVRMTHNLRKIRNVLTNLIEKCKHGL